MAKNRIYELGDQFPLVVPEGTKSGDPLVIGALPCVALTDRGKDGNDPEEATVQCNGVFEFPIVSAAGALDVGDEVFLTSGGDLTRASSGNSHFGYALQGVPTNEAGTIAVKIGW